MNEPSPYGTIYTNPQSNTLPWLVSKSTAIQQSKRENILNDPIDPRFPKKLRAIDLGIVRTKDRSLYFIPFLFHQLDPPSPNHGYPIMVVLGRWDQDLATSKNSQRNTETQKKKRRGTPLPQRNPIQFKNTEIKSFRDNPPNQNSIILLFGSRQNNNQSIKEDYIFIRKIN